jgi:hypothetical protein
MGLTLGPGWSHWTVNVADWGAAFSAPGTAAAAIQSDAHTTASLSMRIMTLPPKKK